MARPARGPAARPGTASAPTGYQTAPGWRALLEFAAGPYAALQRGVARWAGGDRLGAVDAWEQSLRDQPSAIGWRNVAVAYAETIRPAPWPRYREARTLDPTMIGVVIEHLELLLTLGHHEVVLAEIDVLPAAQRTDPMIMLCEARAAVAIGDADRAGRILRPGLVVPGVREGAATLGRLWRDYRVTRRRARDRRGRGAAVGVRLLDAARSVGDHDRRVVVGQLVGVGPLEDAGPSDRDRRAGSVGFS